MAMVMTEATALTMSPFPRILAIDDNADARSALEDGLGNFGFEVKAVPDAHACVSAVSSWTPEAILLGARGSEAFGLIASLRRITDVPIMMIGGCAEVLHKISALTHGADDYITTPFDFEEIAAYVHARLRRPRIQMRDVVTYADVFIDVTHRKVARGGKPIDLSTREFDLLIALARHPEQVFSRTQLLDLVWGFDRDVSMATVETYVSYLRSKLEAGGAAPLIHTLRGVGYTMKLKR